MNIELSSGMLSKDQDIIPKIAPLPYLLQICMWAVL